MRILHTSDWHLGRSFLGLDLLEDQAHVLREFVEIARELRPDVVVIAGDLYDRVVPPLGAVELMDEVLSRLVIDLRLETIAIAGNHDAAERVGFGARLLTHAGLHLIGVAARARPIVRRDEHGEVAFHPLPFALPDQVRGDLAATVATLLSTTTQGGPAGGAVLDPFAPAAEQLGLPLQMQAPPSSEASSEGADPWKTLLQRGQQAQELALRVQIFASLRTQRCIRNVAVAHAFVAGGASSESERDLVVGGSGAVPVSLFDDFDYVALGHLHRPQSVGQPHVRYSGSLLPYSFSEVDPHSGAPLPKSVSLVELGAPVQGRSPGRTTATVETLELHPRRALRVLRGSFDDLLHGDLGDASAGSRDLTHDYILARLTDEVMVLDALARLRARFPNILKVERERATAPSQFVAGVDAKVQDAPNLLDRFAAFFEIVRERSLDTAESEILRRALQLVEQHSSSEAPEVSSQEQGAELVSATAPVARPQAPRDTATRTPRSKRARK